MKNFCRPDFHFENQYENPVVVIGVDEVGRGALAGPVVAGAVYIATCGKGKGVNQEIDWMGLGIDDSKRLSEPKRKQLSEVIQTQTFWSIGEADVETINSLGIVRATGLAMRQAVEKLIEKVGQREAFVLVDGMPIPVFSEMGLKSQSIIKGDQKSVSIAAASIVAKVYRDNLMVNLARNGEFTNYAWQSNKGYGTKVHLQAIEKFGPTVMHRSGFLRSTETVD